jgi:hypothetical protein
LDKEYKILEIFADRIMSLNGGLCPMCVMDVVYDVYEAGKEAGKEIGAKKVTSEIIDSLCDKMGYLT